MPRADREFVATRAIHGAGLPAPAAYELIEVAGRPGIVFERVSGVSLLDATQHRPWAIFAAVRSAAELHADLHRCTAPPGLPSLCARIAARIDRSPAPEPERRRARARLAALPDGAVVCHGDFHPGNILLTPRGPVVIDWSGAGRGPADADLALTSRLLRPANLPPWSPWYARLMLRCLRMTLHRSYLVGYFRRWPGPRGSVAGWHVPLAVAARATPD
jgi:aminoglycoside phosphotransferase (APT) family kinase protein